MRGVMTILAVLLAIGATPALAAPCKTAGTAETAMTFPTGNPSDVPFARSMVPALFIATKSDAPKSVTCTRATASTAQGDYVIGGENGDDFPRVAIRADGKEGPVAYIAASPDAPGTFALIIRAKGGPATVKAFYAGVPTDQRLSEDLRTALSSDSEIMSFDPKQKMVRYGFSPPGGVPPPVTSGSSPSGTKRVAGPQIFIPATGNPALLDMADMRHKPSGFACPQSFDGLAVLLMSIDPAADHLTCDYRAGTDLRYREDDPIRYQLVLVKAPGQSARTVFDQLVAGGRQALKIKGDHAPPLAAGAAPLPEFVVYWDTESDGVQGVWVGHAGGWIVYLRAQYAPSAANDAEAGKVAQILFAQIAKQVR